MRMRLGLPMAGSGAVSGFVSMDGARSVMILFQLSLELS
jgi:hypothetical protein